MKKIFAGLVALALPILASAATLTTPLTIGNTYPNAGTSTAISGSCGNAGANSSVSFSVMQNGTTTQIPSTGNLNTNSSGNFSGNIVYPASISSGPSTLVVTCNASGDIIYSSTLNFAAPVSTNITLPSGAARVNGTYNVNGSCGSSGGAGSVQFTLNSNGTITNLNSLNLNSTGIFSGNVSIPGTVISGPATLTAICSNGATFSSNVNVSPSAVTNFTFGTTPILGLNGNVYGNCSSTPANANGTVNFALVRNGVTTYLSATSNVTNNAGNFNANVFYPATYGGGVATLVVTCPDTSVYNTVVTLGDPIGGLVIPPTTGAVVGVTAPTTPVGGVNAGSPPINNRPFVDSLVMIAALFAGLIAYRVNNAKF